MEKRIYSIFFSCICLVLSVVMLFFLTVKDLMAAENINLSFSNFFPSNHFVNTEEIPAWIKAIEKATNGQVKITVYSGGTMLTGPQTYDGVVSGICDMGVMPPNWAPGRFPAWEVFDLPGLYIPDAKFAAIVTWEATKKLKELQLPDTKLLFLHSTGPGAIYSKNPVRTPKDLKGMQVYATSITADIAKVLGASPVGGGRGEVYIMLQKGTLDGDISGPPEVLLGYKEAEVINYITLQTGQHGLPGFYNKTHFFFMNLDSWNSLPADIQEKFNAVHDEIVPLAGEIWASHMQEGLDFAKECGVEFIELSAEEAADFVKPVLSLADKWASDMEKKGIAGKRILATVRDLCDNYGK
ncbi:MAG: TRAP transporter substrate-binding protein [Deltaproteobacteria bacterium]|nr:TRAP transporter substrate-binding protein [Deltaproteobacteria bacterium]